jgi:CMP-N-acetylneuraminic acid synthetase
MKTAVLIPAKGKSKRIPRKNLQKLGDQSLVERCVQKMLRCKNADKIILDTDSSEVVDICGRYIEEDPRFVIQERSTELLGDNVGTPEICANVLSRDPEIDILGIMHVTAPYLRSETIDKCIEVFTTGRDTYDSLFTVEVLHDYLWKDRPLNFNVDCRTSTDQVDIYYKLTGGFFISSRRYIIENRSFIGHNPVLYPIPVLEALDINYPNELELARIIHAGMKAMGAEREML